jgi:predicted DNA-binding transcriptional regulator YafY
MNINEEDILVIAGYIKRFTIPELAEQMMLKFKLEDTKSNIIREIERIIKKNSNIYTDIGWSGDEIRYGYIKIDSSYDESVKNFSSASIKNKNKYLKKSSPDIFTESEFRKTYIEDLSYKQNEIELLKEAITTKSLVSFNYIGITDEKVTKKTDKKVLKVAEFEGFWYIIVYSDYLKKIYNYRIRNLAQVEIQSEKFELTKEMEINLDDWYNIWYKSDIKPCSLTLRINNKYGKIVSYWFDKNILNINNFPERVRWNDNKTYIEYDLEVTDTWEILNTIRYWMPHVTIIKDCDRLNIIGEYINSLKKTLENHKLIKELNKNK